MPLPTHKDVPPEATVSGREYYYGDAALVPELEYVAHSENHVARFPWLSEHTHPDAYEIFYFVRGQVNLWIGDTMHVLRGNEIHVVPPGMRHGSKRLVAQPSEYYLLRFRPADCAAAKIFPKTAMRDLGEQLAALPPRYVGSRDLTALFKGLLHEHRTKDAFSPVRIRGYLYLLLTRFLALNRASTQTGREVSAPVRRSVDWCLSELADARVSNMARIAGLAPALFRERFEDEVGLAPSDFILRQRLERAKALLLKGQRVTEIAHQVGFSSSQHFATAFKRVEGISPSEFADAGVES